MPRLRAVFALLSASGVACFLACSSFEDSPDGATADPDASSTDVALTDAVVSDDAPDPGRDAGDSGSLTQSAKYRAAVLADDPIAYWRMGKVESGVSVVDEKNNVNPLLLTGTDFTPDAAGVFDDDPAVWFGGASNASPIDPLPFGFTGKAPFTLECWARRELPDGGGSEQSYQHLISNVEGSSTAPDGSTMNGYLLMTRTLDPVGTYASHGALAGGPIEAKGPFVGDGEWGYVAMVMDGTNITVYVNGVAGETQAVKGNITTRVSAVLTIAKASNDARWFRGYLDEVAIYSRALPAKNILAHYKAARP